jgi:hypothetical protein
MHAALWLAAMAIGILFPDWIAPISPARRPKRRTSQ